MADREPLRLESVMSPVTLPAEYQDVLDELVDIVGYVGLEDGALIYHLRRLRYDRSRCRQWSETTIKRRLLALQKLGLVERVPGSRPAKWLPTEQGRAIAVGAAE